MEPKSPEINREKEDAAKKSDYSRAIPDPIEEHEIGEVDYESEDDSSKTL